MISSPKYRKTISFNIISNVLSLYFPAYNVFTLANFGPIYYREKGKFKIQWDGVMFIKITERSYNQMVACRNKVLPKDNRKKMELEKTAAVTNN